ncbi:hypothetical protein D3C87_1515230 [compost metagenome]
MVWKAISSITPVIWAICWAEVSISRMAVTVSSTTSPLRRALWRVASTISRARSAPSEAWRTVAVTCSRAAAVSSSEAACCSVRRDRSSEAWLISVVVERMPAALPMITVMVSSSRPMARLKSSRSLR